MKHFYKMLLLTVACSLVFTGCGRPAESGVTVYETPPADALDGTIKAAGVYQVAENSQFKLSIDGTDSSITLTDKQTGAEYDTLPRDLDLTNDSYAYSRLKSALIIDYLDGSNNSKSLNSYENGVKNGGFSFSAINGGVRVSYTLTEEARLYLAPMVISQKRFETFLAAMDEEQRVYVSERYMLTTIRGLSAEEAGYMTADYPSLKNGDLYILIGDNMPDFVMERLAAAFESAGYTLQELENDNRENYLPAPQLPAEFHVSVEYVLGEEGLEVTIPRKYISCSSFVHLNRLTLLSAFGAAGAGDSGYILVPDGSGAILSINSPKTAFDPIELPVFGQDYAITQQQKYTNTQQVYLPVFGLGSDKGTFIGIIGSGAASANIHADVSGRDHPYNTVYCSFDLQETDLLSPGDDPSKTVYEIAGLTMECDISLLYKFLPPGAGYAQMAQSYRQHLLNSGLVPQSGAGDDIGFMLSLIGAVDYRSTFLTFPVKDYKALTTFKQAQEIADKLSQSGVKRLEITYRSWVNGGFNNSLNNRVDIIRALGGKKDLNALSAYAADHTIGLYPDVNFLTVQSPKFGSFNKYAGAAKTITDEIAYMYDYDKSTNRRKTATAKTIIKPSRLEKYVNDFLKSYKKLNITGISVGNMGYQLSADYSSGGTERNAALDMVAGSFYQLNKAGLNVISQGANAYALPFLSGLSDIPMQSSGYEMYTASVPFMQIVLHGVMPYYAPPLNYESQYENAFLRCIEYGAYPQFEWTYAGNAAFKKTDYDFYETHYTVWLDGACRKYQKLNRLLSPLTNVNITDHRQLEKDVFATTYADGTVIYVNYGEKAAQADGFNIPAGDCLAVKEGVAI